MFAIPLTAWSPTDRARQMMADLELACRRGRGMLKGTFGYPAPELSRVLSLRKSSMLARLADEPDVEQELIKVRAERYGLRVLDADVAELLTDALREKKRMAKMEG